MKKFTLIFLVLAVGLSLSSQESDEALSEVYEKKVIIDAKWGDKPGEFVKFDNPEGPSTGPSSFAIDLDGNIYIIDMLISRVQRFSSNGKYISLFVYDTTSDYLKQFWAIDIITDTEGGIYLLGYLLADPYEGEVRKYNKEGDFQHKYRFTMEALGMDSLIPEGLRGTGYKLEFTSIMSTLCLQIEDGKVMINDLILGTPMSPYQNPEKYPYMKKCLIHKRIKSNSGNKILIRFTNEEKLWITLPQEIMFGAEILKVDVEQNVYLIGRRSSYIWEEEFLKYDSKGNLVAEVVFQPSMEYDWNKYFEIDEKNNFYVMENDEKGLKIIKYEEQEVQE